MKTEELLTLIQYAPEKRDEWLKQWMDDHPQEEADLARQMFELGLKLGSVPSRIRYTDRDIYDFVGQNKYNAGFGYARDHMVTHLMRHMNTITGYVFGQKTYTVDVTLTPTGEINSNEDAYSCTCPDAEYRGTPCKHVAAVLIVAKEKGL